MGSQRLILVDGSGYIFRAFYALPPMSREDGTPVNAVFGFTSMLLKLSEDMEGENILVVFDAARTTFRNAIYKEYKANRSEPPEELVPQFDLIKKATTAIGLKSLEVENYEADDIIATYVKIAKKENIETLVISSIFFISLVNDNMSSFSNSSSSSSSFFGFLIVFLIDGIRFLGFSTLFHSDAELISDIYIVYT